VETSDLKIEKVFASSKIALPSRLRKEMSTRENKLQYLELKSKLTALNYTETFKEE